MKQAVLNTKFKNAKDDSHIIIGISVGQDYHEGEQLLALVRLINDEFSNSRCTIAVCDTLQRHSLRFIKKEMTMEKAYNLSLQNGEKWMERNSSTLGNLKIPYEIKRWNEWRGPNQKSLNKDFLCLLEKVKEQYKTDPSFEKAINKSITQYVRRHISRESDKIANLDLNLIKFCCEAYLLEECAVIMLMWPDILKHDYLLYPANMTPALKKAQEIFVHSNHSLKNKPEWIKFTVKDNPGVSNQNKQNSYQGSVTAVNSSLFYPCPKELIFSPIAMPADACRALLQAQLNTTFQVMRNTPPEYHNSLMKQFALLASAVKVIPSKKALKETPLEKILTEGIYPDINSKHTSITLGNSS